MQTVNQSITGRMRGGEGSTRHQPALVCWDCQRSSECGGSLVLCALDGDSEACKLFFVPSLCGLHLTTLHLLCIHLHNHARRLTLGPPQGLILLHQHLLKRCQTNKQQHASEHIHVSIDDYHHVCVCGESQNQQACCCCCCCCGYPFRLFVAAFKL